ncbi:MAG: 3-isopropylmalate dehydratase [Planctomycetota bacterium]|nr:MAG: 3-isopropylmalate dehydratase [Planctomycetota bacterium]
MKLENIIQGKAYVLGDNIDTDQIIPAEFLTLNPAIAEEYRQFGRHALAGVPPAQGGLPKGHVPFHKNETDLVSDYQIIVGGRNFGCGSSREHAPIALDAAGIKAVVAEFYARIFYRNAVNGGYIVPAETAERLCEKVCTGDELRINLEACIMENLTTGEKYSLRPLGEVVPILEAGGVFPYARSKGMLPS